jgi:hypothetical protein
LLIVPPQAHERMTLRFIGPLGLSWGLLLFQWTRGISVPHRHDTGLPHPSHAPWRRWLPDTICLEPLLGLIRPSLAAGDIFPFYTQHVLVLNHCPIIDVESKWWHHDCHWWITQRSTDIYRCISRRFSSKFSHEFLVLQWGWLMEWPRQGRVLSDPRESWKVVYLIIRPWKCEACYTLAYHRHESLGDGHPMF